MNSNSIYTAANFIRAGKTVAMPTETVYGLGANALDPMAVARIFEIKERPFFDPLIVHIASTDIWSTLSTPVPRSLHDNVRQSLPTLSQRLSISD